MPKKGKRKGKGNSASSSGGQESSEQVQRVPDKNVSSDIPVEEITTVAQRPSTSQTIEHKQMVTSNIPKQEITPTLRLQQPSTSQVNITEIPQRTTHEARETTIQEITEATEKVLDLVEVSNRMVITEGLPHKLQPGRLGKRVQVETNLYNIELLPGGFVYHYDVQILNRRSLKTDDLSALVVDKRVKRYRCLSTKINRKIIEQLLLTDANFKNSYAVYDGQKNMYAPAMLKMNFPYETTVVYQDKVPYNDQGTGKKVIPEIREDDKFKVIIKPVEKKSVHGMKSKNCAISFEPLHALFQGKKLDINDIQEAMMALETIFRHSPAKRFVPIGRSFFHPSLGQMHPLGGGIEIWFGYHQSSRLGQWKPMINLNTTATTFFSKISLLEYFAKAMNINRGALQSVALVRENDRNRISNELKNVKIEVDHQKQGYKRKYTIVKLTRQDASKLEFELEDKNTKAKRKTTVRDYFRDEYHKRLECPNLPCVQVKPINKSIYFPLEVCQIIEGQHCKKELSPYDQAEMIKYTAQPPKNKFREIATTREKHANYDSDPVLQKYNIKVSNDPIKVTAREIETPNLNYGQGKACRPNNGTWNIIGMEFFRGVKIDSWYLLSLASERDCRKDDLNKFVFQLCKIGGAAGIKFDQLLATDIISANRPGPDGKQDQIRKMCEKFKQMSTKKVQLIVVVIPNKCKILYQGVKQLAEVEIGLMTQCIDHKNVNKCNGSTISNLCQKINAKMGGINHTLTQGEIPKVFAKPVIIMGADVSHAGVTDKSGISVAAVVGSLDMILSRFAVTCKLQRNSNEKKRAEEIINDLAGMVKNLLLAFYNHTRQKPGKIIFYRDGVSEGQFSEVKEKEITAIRSACTQLQADYRPLISFIVVQKRHNVRCKPVNERDGARPENNVKPGTVIDTTIVHPLHRDFYLCSHLGLKGTSRPGYYTILLDDNDFSADEFQTLTHYLCFTFARCTKSISCPVPVRYAHLAAYRMRLLMQQVHNYREEAFGESGEISAEILGAINISEAVRQKMYFV